MAQAKTEGFGLKVGDYAPDFNMPTDGGGYIDLGDLRDKKNVVLYFYPKDDTPGCTVEAKDFAALRDQFAKLDTEIIGVSRDEVKSHDKFKEKYCLTFTLASDETGTVTEAYGVWAEKNMYGKKYMGIERTTFLINKKGIIAKIWSRVSVNGHAEEVLKEVKAIK